MPHATGGKLKSMNYSHCPIKKRPIKLDSSPNKDLSQESASKNLGTTTAAPTQARENGPPEPYYYIQPENLSVQPQDLRLPRSRTHPNPDVPIPDWSQSQTVHGPVHGSSPGFWHWFTTNFQTLPLNHSGRSQIQSLSSPDPKCYEIPDFYFRNNNRNTTTCQNVSNWAHQNNNEFSSSSEQIMSHSSKGPMNFHVPSKESLISYPPVSMSSSPYPQLFRHQYPRINDDSNSDPRAPSRAPLIANNNNNNNGRTQAKSRNPVNNKAPSQYQCPDCNKSYSSPSSLAKHIQVLCSVGFEVGRPQHLNDPKNSNSSFNSRERSFCCKFCLKGYGSLGALKMHVRTHTLPCKCSYCGKAFSRPWLLQGHVRTHTGEKPFHCSHCSRAFADRSNLRAHEQTHSEMKKYPCSNCSRTFSRISLLVKHEEQGWANCSASSMSSMSS